MLMGTIIRWSNICLTSQYFFCNMVIVRKHVVSHFYVFDAEIAPLNIYLCTICVCTIYMCTRCMYYIFVDYMYVLYICGLYVCTRKTGIRSNLKVFFDPSFKACCFIAMSVFLLWVTCWNFCLTWNCSSYLLGYSLPSRQLHIQS